MVRVHLSPPVTSVTRRLIANENKPKAFGIFEENYLSKTDEFEFGRVDRQRELQKTESRGKATK